MKFVDTMHGKVTAKDGVLWRAGQMVSLPEADRIAKEHGYQYAEQLVAALQYGDEPEKEKAIERVLVALILDLCANKLLSSNRAESLLSVLKPANAEQRISTIVRKYVEAPDEPASR